MYLITGLHTGGAEMLVRDISRKIDKEKFEITIVSILSIGDIGKQIQDSDIRVISLDTGSKYNPVVLFKLFKILKREKPDILHTHLFHADILGRIAGSIVGVPKIISTIHNVEFGGLFREKLLSWTRSLVDMNIAVSRKVAEKVVEKGVSKKENVYIIYNGINLENFPNKDKQEMRENLNLETDKPVFVSVGSLTQQKGYQYLLEAVKDINNDALFIILGEGSERKKLENKIKEYKLGDMVLLRGNVDNVNDYLQAADFFIMPSLWEGFSVALLEAAWAGKVIIATDVGGNAEIIIDNKTGFLLESKDAKKIAEKINHVLTLPPEKKNSISQQVKKRVEDEFSMQKMLDNYQNLYE